MKRIFFLPALCLATITGYAENQTGTLATKTIETGNWHLLPTNGIITTVAGNGNYGYAGDGGSATGATLYGPGAVKPDAFGNFYIADTYNQVIRKVDSSGTITTVAGRNGLGAGYSGDGGPATSAQLCNPMTISLWGNDLLIADLGNNVIRMVDVSSDNISTAAGNHSLGAGYSGDSGAATSAQLDSASATAKDAHGNLYIADLQNNVVRKVDACGTITTVAGNDSLGAGYSGDGGPATSAALNFPAGVAVDEAGNLYIADTGNNVIRKVSTRGLITTYAGNQSLGGQYSGDGGPATGAALNYPQGETVDTAGNLYFADSGNGVVRKVSVNGVITTVAGNASLNGGYSGDGGAATQAALNWPVFASVDRLGNLYIADCYNNAIRKVTPHGIITTIAGNGNYGYAGDGGPATSATLYGPGAVEPDAFGNIYIADTYNQVIRKVDSCGAITTVAGSNGSNAGYSGDGGPATSAQLCNPMTISLWGNALWIADIANNVIRMVDFVSGDISTVAGNRSLGAGYSGDGGPATSAQLDSASATAKDAHGNLYIADLQNNVVRKVDARGTITTVAGNDSLGAGYSGDGGPATSAALNFPAGVAVDEAGNLYIADTGNNVIRKVSTRGLITTYAGNQSLGGQYSGDGGPATGAALNYPQGETVDTAGNLYFADSGNGVVRKVSVNGVITTVAGNASLNGGYSGDGGDPTQAALNWPVFVSVDGLGNLYIADCYNNAIRKVTFIAVRPW